MSFGQFTESVESLLTYADFELVVEAGPVLETPLFGLR